MAPVWTVWSDRILLMAPETEGVLVGEARVVIGLDGCDACQAALRYAVGEARRRGCQLVVVSAYEHGRSAYRLTGYVVSKEQDPAGDAEDMALRCLQLAGIGDSPDDPAWKIVTKEMLPADALASAARGAHMLVVGRHHGQVPGEKPVGSTTASLLHHSPVPVVSVHPGYQPEPGAI